MPTKIINNLFALLVLALFSAIGLFATPVKVSALIPSCEVTYPGSYTHGLGGEIPEGTTQHYVGITIPSHVGSFNPNANFRLAVYDSNTGGGRLDRSGVIPGTTQPIAFYITDNRALTKGGMFNTDNKHWVALINESNTRICNLGYYKVPKSSSGTTLSCKEMTVYQKRNGQTCYGGCFDTSSLILFKGSGLRGPLGAYSGPVILKIKTASAPDIILPPTFAINGSFTAAYPFINSLAGNIKIEAYEGRFGGIKRFHGCEVEFTLINNPPGCGTGPQSCLLTKPKNAKEKKYRICDQISKGLVTAGGKPMYDRCVECVGGDADGKDGIWTAVGCIPKDPDVIVSVAVRLGLGLGGGFALLNILVSGFMLSISQGEPKKVSEAKEILVGALAGLLFIIFSVVILHFIGFTVLKLPGFGG